MIWTTIFNPFLKFSEKQLFVTGLLFLILNSVAAYFLDFKSDSIFHFSTKGNLSFSSVLLFSIFSILLAFAILFVLGKIYNRKTRWIDILNAVLISQVFNFLIILLSKLINVEQIAKKASENMQLEISDLLLLFLFLIFTLPLTVYGFILIYNGFRTATNLKSWQKTVIFVLVLFGIITFSPLLLSTLKLK